MSLNQKQSTTTTTGKCFSLIIYSYFLYSFIKSDLVNKTNAQTLGQNYVQTPRPSLYFGKQNFTFAVGVADENNNFFIDDTIFHLEAGIYHRNNNDQSVSKQVNNMRPCTQSDFLEDPEEFIKLGLKGTLCSPFENFNVSGSWDEENVDYFWIELKICSNSSKKNNICKSPEEIANFFSKNYLDVYITKNSIDASDYFTPYSRSMNIFYKQLNVNIMKSFTLYMMQSILETNDGLLYDNFNQINSYFIGEVESDFTYKRESDETLCTFAIYSSSSRNFITRKYQNIQDLLAQIGGLSNLFIFFAFIICKIENQYTTMSLIGNELFVFQKSNYHEVSKKNSFLKEKTSSPRFFENAFHSLFQRLNISRTGSMMKKSTTPLELMENLDVYQKIKQKENRFVLGFFKFLWLSFVKKKQPTEEEILFLQAQKQIKSELDILKIMKKLQDIEKLKKILLSEEQLYLFNLMSKPMIKVAKIVKFKKKQLFQVKFQFSEKGKTNVGKTKLLEIYKQVQQKSQDSEVDSRILKMLDEDVKSFLGTLKP